MNLIDLSKNISDIKELKSTVSNLIKGCGVKEKGTCISIVLSAAKELENVFSQLEIILALPNNNKVLLGKYDGEKFEPVWKSEKFFKLDKIGISEMLSEMGIYKLDLAKKNSNNSYRTSFSYKGQVYSTKILYLVEHDMFSINFEEHTRVKEDIIDILQLSLSGAKERDPETGEHMTRTALINKFIAIKLKENYPKKHDSFLDKDYEEIITIEYLEDIEKVSPLHDLGKIGIPDAILNKPGKLDNEEFEIMKRHSVIGAKLISEYMAKLGEDFYVLQIAKNIALYHHEKWDGSGYPYGISGEEIPLEARIMAISDVFDALLSERPYKEAFTIEKTVGILKEGRGTHFDPIILDIFIENIFVALDIRNEFTDA